METPQHGEHSYSGSTTRSLREIEGTTGLERHRIGDAVHSDGDTEKLCRQGLAVPFIEELWRLHSSRMKVDHHNPFSDAQLSNDAIASDESRALVTSVRTCENSAEVASLLRDRMLESMIRDVVQLGQKQNALDAFEGHDWQNFALVLQMSRPLSQGKPELMLLSGLKTGVNECWKMMLVCAELLQQKHGEAERERFLAVAQSSERTLTALASTHLRLFSHYAVSTGEGDSLIQPGIEASFVLRGENGHERVDVAPEVLGSVRPAWFDADQAKFSGCPALKAKAGIGGNVITDLYARVTKVAEHYFLPHFTHLHR